MSNVQVYNTHCDDNGNPYYRTIPNKQLLVVVDGAWHTAIDDGCWEEADSPVNMDINIIEIVSKPEDLLTIGTML